jgi:hypothetical protein
MQGAVGHSPIIVRQTEARGEDDAGFSLSKPVVEEFEQPEWWNDEALPEPMRGGTGHGGSHTLLTHEFVDALMRDRTPAVHIELALAMTAAACVAHESALRNGELLPIPDYTL